MTQTLTLTDFLLQRIAEDEAEVQNALALHGSGTTWRLGHALDPARVLAECEAKRRTVEWLVMEPRDEQPLRFLALPYADHEDYREEWKP